MVGKVLLIYGLVILGFIALDLIYYTTMIVFNLSLDIITATVKKMVKLKSVWKEYKGELLG